MIKKEVYIKDGWNPKNPNLNMADYYYFDDGFTDKEIEKIKKLALKYPAENAGVGQDKTGHTDDKVRKSTVRWLYDFPSWVTDKLLTMVDEANDHLWDFNLHSCQESMQYTEYPPDGGHYDWHMDCGHGIQHQRKVSITVQLNDDYKGGELQIHNGSNPSTLKKKKGTVVIFPSYMLHRVTPVTKGVRNSLVLWLGGDHYR